MAIPGIAILSLLLAFVGALAILGALPGISRLLVYLFFRPDLVISFGGPPGEKRPLQWHELTENEGDDQQTPPNVISRSDKDLTVEVEFHLSEPWPLKEHAQRRVTEVSLGGVHNFRSKMQPWLLPANSTFGPTFPYEPEPEDCTLTVVVYPTVHLSGFCIPYLGYRLPRYFGEVDLRPIREDFEIVGDTEE